MSVVQILREAKAVVLRAHTPTQLAVNAQGVNVRPLDPSAVAWSSTGALGKVAPWMSAQEPADGKPPIWFDLTVHGYEAWELLDEAARLQGYRLGEAPIVSVDKAGLRAVLACFAKAIWLAPTEPAHYKPSATGSQPRGQAA